MPIDIVTPESPGWWLKRLSTKLDDRRKRIQPLYDRYEGNAPVPVSLRNAPETAQRFYCTSRTNFADMVIKAIRYRLKVALIQTSREAGDVGDEEAWKAWRKAGMLVEGPDIIRHFLLAGDGYSLTAKSASGEVATTSEDPRQMVTIHDPVRQSRIRAAGKFFNDPDEGRDYAYLYRPGRVWRAMSDRKSRTKVTSVRFGSAWDWDESMGGVDGVPLPLGFEDAMMVVRYRNDEGVGEFERHTDILDRVDHLILQGMVVATMQAFKQRAIKVEPKDMPDKDPETGEDIDYDDMFLSSPDALWKLPQSAEMWESGAVDVTPITTMISKEIERISAVMFTPLSMFTPEGANQSAQGASLVREGMTFKVEDKQERLGHANALTASLIFRLTGDGLEAAADPDEIRIGWAPAERFSLAERYDAAVKAKASGVPWRTIMTDVLGFSPDQVTRMASDRMSDEMLFPAEANANRAADASVNPNGA